MLYNAAVWHLNSDVVMTSYMEHLLVPRVFARHVSGIPNITGITLHLKHAHLHTMLPVEM